MYNQQTNTRPAVAIPSVLAPVLVLKKMLAWIVAKDQAYRAAHHFQNLADESLKDVGLQS